jgi:hypothetical protein
MPLHLRPIRLRDAAAYIEGVHRHHAPPRGYKFAVGVADDEGLRGVATAGRPVARHLDDGWTLEVTRVATDGTPNACSMLYGACWRAARALGYTRIVTYTQAGETGASLRAAGYTAVVELGPRTGWDTPSRHRQGRGADGVNRCRWEIGSGNHAPTALALLPKQPEDPQPALFEPGAAA